MAFYDFILGTGKVEVPGAALNYKTANSPATGGLLLLLVAAEVTVLGMSTVTEDGYSQPLAIGVTSVVIGAFVLYYMSMVTRRERRCPLAPDIMIFWFLVLFHLPGIFFDALGAVNQEVHFWYGYTYVNHVLMLDISGILSFLIGYNIFAKAPSAYKGRTIPPIEMSPIWMRFGQFLFMIGMLFHAYFSMTQISVAKMLTEKYTMDRYHSQEFDERWWFAGMFLCRTALIIMCVTSCVIHKKMLAGWYNWGAFVLYMAFIFVTGHRTIVVLMVIPPLFAYSFLVKPITTKTLLLIAAAGLSMMTVGIAIRQLDQKSIEGIQRAVSEQAEHEKGGAMFHSILEAGNSAKSMFRARSVWPNREPFEMGNTILQGLLRSIPNLGPTAGMLFPSENPAHKTMRLTEYAAWKRGIGYGFSIIGEAYINWGLLGPPFFMMLIGFITRRIFDRAFYERNLYKMVMAMIWVIGVLGWVRNDSYSAIKPITWAMLLMLGARMVLNSSAAKAAAEQAARLGHPPSPARA